MTGRNRNHTIDYLRAFAILLVMVGHFFGAFVGPAPRLIIAFYGVTVFFVISGFLITSNVLKRYGAPEKISLPAFYSMRFARIAPPLAFTLTLLSACVIAGLGQFHLPAGVSLWQPILAALTFTSNIFYKYHNLGYQWDVLWSLSVEEVFYLCLPVLFLLGRRRIVPVLIILTIFALLYRAQGYNALAYQSCFDGLAIGCLTAIAAARASIDRRARIIAIVAGIIVFVAAYSPAPGYWPAVLGPTGIAGGTALLIYGTANIAWSKPSPATAPLRWIGRFSYELYLLHGAILILMIQYEVPRSYAPVTFAIFMSICVGVCFPLGLLIFEPLNRWLRRTLTGLSEKYLTAPDAAGSEPIIR